MVLKSRVNTDPFGLLSGVQRIQDPRAMKADQLPLPSVAGVPTEIVRPQSSTANRPISHMFSARHARAQGKFN